MLVDVIELRRKGVKLPPEVYMAATPIRGKLVLSDGRPGRYSSQRDVLLLAGVVKIGETVWAMPPLDCARVTKIRDGQMLIIGKQDAMDGLRLKDPPAFRQVWWCRLVLDEGAAG